MSGEDTRDDGGGEDAVGVSDVLEELYGADPDDFIRTRTRVAAQARARGDRDAARRISELRKPTVSAWAVNRLVRERPVEVERLLDLGRRMRAAQASLDVSQLHGLRSERDSVLEAFTRAARFVADDGGHGLSVTAATAVRATAVAALADERAADAVASGALVRTLDYAGFGEVDLDDAVAEGFTPVRRTRRPTSGAATDVVGAQATGTTKTGTAKSDATQAGAQATGRTKAGAAKAGTTKAGTTKAGTTKADDSAHRALLRRLEEETAEADQELARASLVAAERERQAGKATARVEELSRLLDAARAEAADRDAAAREAESDRERALSEYQQARDRLDAHKGTGTAR